MAHLGYPHSSANRPPHNKRGVHVSIPTSPRSSTRSSPPSTASTFTLPLLHSQASPSSSSSPPTSSSALSPPSARRRPRPISGYVRRGSVSSPALPSSSSYHALTVPASPPKSPSYCPNSPSPSSFRPPNHLLPNSRRHSLHSAQLQSSSLPHGPPSPHTLPTWPGTHQLRRLFRYFDRDGDGLISLPELSAGLLSLGFDTSSYTSLIRFSAELRADSDGMIKESSFVRAFRKLNREKIVEELRRGAEEEEKEEAEDMKIVMAVIGLEDQPSINGQHETPTEDLQPEELLPVGRYAEYSFKPSQLSAYLIPGTPPLAASTSAPSSGGTGSCPPSPTAAPSSLWSNKVTWLDVIGLHTPTLSFLSNHFSLPPSTFDPALISLDSVARVEFDHDALHDHGVMSVLTHAISIDLLPYRKRSGKERADYRRRPHSHRSHLSDEFTLLSDREYRHKRPSLTSLPIHVIIVGTHTVITIHPLTSTPALDDIFSEFRALLSQSILHSLPFSQSSSSLVGMRLSTAKTLSIELLDEVADWNWSLRDLLKQWKVLLSETLSDGWVSSGLLEHIHDLENLSLCAARLVAPQARMLQELVTDEAVGQGGPGSGEKGEVDHTATTQHSGSALNQTWSEAGGGKKGGGGGGPSLTREKSTVFESLNSSLRSLSTLRRQRGAFLGDVSLDLRNLSKSVSRLSEQLKLTNDLSQPLLSYYKQRKEEETNKILYLLTVVTTIVTPLQLTSGVYGMNLKMPEQQWPYSYPLFWAVNLVVLLAVALFFKKKKWL